MARHGGIRAQALNLMPAPLSYIARTRLRASSLERAGVSL
jgi:hypothetical protein